jgi:hypothetical protein
MADEALLELVGDAVDGMALGHGGTSLGGTV